MTYMGVEIMYLGERVGEDAQDEKGTKDDPVELLEEKKIRLALDHQTPVCEPHEDHSEEEVVEIDNDFFNIFFFFA